MNKTLEFLRHTGTFYLATMDGDQPRVRPMSVAVPFKGRLYICSANNKPCFHQIMANHRVEIAAFDGDVWLRLTGKLESDNSREAKQAIFDDSPFVSKMFTLDDGIFEPFYFTEATAIFTPFLGEPTTETFSSPN